MSARLLPKDTNEFSNAKFWEGFFKKRGAKAFEWYGEYTDLMHLWSQYVRANDRVLNIGCGNSDLGERLLETQLCSLVANIDTSELVIEQMRKRQRRKRGGCGDSSSSSLTYEVMNAAELTYPDCSFNCIVDKGTLDALMSGEDDESAASNNGIVDRMLSECQRVLQIGGRHIIVSLCQGHVVEKLTARCRGGDWILRVHECPQLADSAFPLPVFFLVFTKLRVPMPGGGIVEVVDASSSSSSSGGGGRGGGGRRLAIGDSLSNWIQQLQSASLSLRSTLAEDGQFQYANSDNGLAVYSCHLLTTKINRVLSDYAVFLTPLGVNIDKEERRRIANAKRLRRLLIVDLHPWLSYESESGIKASLSGFVMRYAPSETSSTTPDQAAQFLSTGQPVYPFTARKGEGEGVDWKLVRLEFGEGDAWRVLTPGSGQLCDVVCCHGCQQYDERHLTVARELLQLLANELGENCAAVEAPYQLELLSSNWRMLSLLLGNGDAKADAMLAAIGSLLKLSPGNSESGSRAWQRVDSVAKGSCSLLAYFPMPIDRESYARAIEPQQQLSQLCELISDEGCLVLSTRLFESVNGELDSALDWLKSRSQFSLVLSCDFNELDAVERSHRLVVCKSGNVEAVNDILARIQTECQVKFA